MLQFMLRLEAPNYKCSMHPLLNSSAVELFNNHLVDAHWQHLVAESGNWNSEARNP